MLRQILYGNVLISSPIERYGFSESMNEKVFSISKNAELEKNRSLLVLVRDSLVGHIRETLTKIQKSTIFLEPDFFGNRKKKLFHSIDPENLYLSIGDEIRAFSMPLVRWCQLDVKLATLKTFFSPPHLQF